MEKKQYPEFREGFDVVMHPYHHIHFSFYTTRRRRSRGIDFFIAQKMEDRVIEVKGGPESIIWIVQLSDLHFSVHHPERALDFKRIVGPALKMINPSLVLITGDLTDGKSKDLLTMKQNEVEWIEYRNAMEDVARRSGLDKRIFYDLRGNHDNFGIGGSSDFFSNYSINGQFGRKGNLNSVTVETGDRKHLFIGLDSTMSAGVRGPTNLFGHPTDQLLAQIDSQLSQWDSEKGKPITKISFGHFPLSFSALSHSQKSLKDLNMHQKPSESARNCSSQAPPLKEFWEWEMGDWRKSRAMRIMAVDRVVARIYDTRPGSPHLIMETTMTKFVRDVSRGDIYAAAWNYKAFEDPSPDRFWLQIEVTDAMGRSTLSELRPFSDLCRIPVVWFGILGYLIYLISCPWLIGQVFTDGENRGYMTYMGWVVKNFNNSEKHEYIGSPDIMVVVLSHFFFVVIPSILVAGALAAERGICKEHFLSPSDKKEDDDSSQKNKRSVKYDNQGRRINKFLFVERLFRKILLVIQVKINGATYIYFILPGAMQAYCPQMNALCMDPDSSYPYNLTWKRSQKLYTADSRNKTDNEISGFADREIKRAHFALSPAMFLRVFLATTEQAKRPS
ncbi:hypothetical protein NC653_020615 [Populus alba x Populus x berolinensis]|uniref:Calcineurin-like phosphoesterase domain-containing protein n=1 Tax=Populus alba x Populus x berolinensis TaxID=444605 RepID=A0AAD6QDY4_9ROSI|nr:hypothetical protein NC653_020615 [Populus alba x Populus x berolinensis]